MKGPDQQNLHMSTSGWLFFIIKCHLPVDHSLNVWIYLSASIVKCVEKRIKVQRTIKMIKYLGRMLYWFVMFTLKRKRLRSGYLNALKLISSWFRKKKKKRKEEGKREKGVSLSILCLGIGTFGFIVLFLLLSPFWPHAWSEGITLSSVFLVLMEDSQITTVKICYIYRNLTIKFSRLKKENTVTSPVFCFFLYACVFVCV